MGGKTLCRYISFNDWVAICKLDLISWADICNPFSFVGAGQFVGKQEGNPSRDVSL